MSALPAASKTLFGCQSTERTVDRIGFLSRRETHQLFSGSNEQIAIALVINTSSEPLKSNRKDDHIPSTTGYGKLVFKRTPTHICCCAVDPEEDKRWLPDLYTCQRVRSKRPHVGVAVLRGCHNPVGVGSPVNTGDEFVVLMDAKVVNRMLPVTK